MASFKSLSENDLRQLELLNLQEWADLTIIYSDILSYIATLESKQIVLKNYDITTGPNPDVTTLVSLNYGMMARIVYLFLGYRRLDGLILEKKRGEITYSLTPNYTINLANFLAILYYYYSILGAEGIYARDLQQPVIGV